MYYLIVGTVYAVTQLVFILTRNISIPLDFFFYSWLMDNGLLQYRDFFMNHGFLLYYFLIPFTRDQSLTAVRLVYIITQTLNITLVLVALRRFGNKWVFAACGMFYILLSFFVSINHFWDETILTTLYLLVYLYSSYAYIRKWSITDIIITLASWIKPTAAILLFPLMFVQKRLRGLFAITFLWILLLFYFWYQGGLTSFIDNLFLFNKHHGAFFFTDTVFYLNRTTVLLVWGITGIGIILLGIQKKISEALYILSFIASAYFLSFIPCCMEFHALPAVAFFTIFLGYLIVTLRGIPRYIIFLVLLFFTAHVYRKAKYEYVNISKRVVTYFDDTKTMARIHALRMLNLPQNTFYVYGNQVEIYYLLHSLPPTYYPVIYPVVSSYYKSLEENIIQELRIRNVEFVIVPLPVDQSFLPLQTLLQDIRNRYERIEANQLFELYKKRIQ